MCLVDLSVGAGQVRAVRGLRGRCDTKARVALPGLDYHRSVIETLQ